MKNLILATIIAIGLIGCGGTNSPKPQKISKTSKAKTTKTMTKGGSIIVFLLFPNLYKS